VTQFEADRPQPCSPDGNKTISRNKCRAAGPVPRIKNLSEVPGFMERRNPSPALLRSVPDGTGLRRAPSPLGEGCHFWRTWKLGKLPSHLGLILIHIFGWTRGWVHSAPTGRPSKAQAIGLGQKVHPISGSQALKGRDKDHPPASTTVRVDPRTLYRPFRAYGQMGMGSRTQAIGLG